MGPFSFVEREEDDPEVRFPSPFPFPFPFHRVYVVVDEDDDKRCIQFLPADRIGNAFNTHAFILLALSQNDTTDRAANPRGHGRRDARIHGRRAVSVPPRVRPRLLPPPMRLGRGSVLLLPQNETGGIARRRRRSIRAQNAPRVDRVAVRGGNVDRRVVARGTRDHRGDVPRSRVVLGRLTYRRPQRKVNTIYVYAKTYARERDARATRVKDGDHATTALLTTKDSSSSSSSSSSSFMSSRTTRPSTNPKSFRR